MVNEKILVTGGAGFFGGHICEELLKKKYDVVLVDILNSETTSAKNKQETLMFLESINNAEKKSKLKSYICDIKDETALTKIFVDEKPTIVIHAASLVMDRASINVPLDFIQTNMIGSQIILNATLKTDKVKKIIFISSRSAIGEAPEAFSLMNEDDSFRPVNPYGATKAAAEHLFHSFYHNYNIPITICRMNPMYGPRCRPDMFVWRLLNSVLFNEVIEKYGTGEAVRDWLFVKDAVDAIILMLFEPSGHEIINLGTGIGTSTNELIDKVERITGEKINIRQVAPILGDAHFGGIANCSKAKDLIGWEAKTILEEGIKITYDYMKKSHMV